MDTKVFKGIGLFLIIVLASTGVFLGLSNRKAEDETENREDTKTIIEETGERQGFQNSEIQIVDQNIEANVIIEILRSTDEIYLKNSSGADYLVYLTDKDIKNIENILSVLELERTNIPIIFQEFNYELYLQSKNIHIYFNESRVFIEDDSGFSGYRADPEKLANLMSELEAEYLDHLNTYIQEIVPKEIIIEAIDNNEKIVADVEITKDIKNTLELTGVIHNSTMKKVSPEYPLYKVTIKSEARNAVLTFIDNEVIQLEIMGEASYYNTNPELYELIKDSIHEKDEEEQLLFSSLFDAYKVIVGDTGDKFDFEDQSYYRLEIIRALIKAEKAPVQKEIGPRDKIRASLTFVFSDKEARIIVYDDYIQYEDKLYRSPLIADNIYKIITQ